MTKEYAIYFDEILEDVFYFELANGDCGVLEKGVRVIYRRSDKKYILHSLSNNYEEEAPDCELKFLLMSREKRFNVMDQVQEEPPSSPAVFVTKVQKVGYGWAIKLSNQMIQLVIDDQNYLLWGKKAWEISSSKEKEISISKLKKGEARGNSDHLQILSRILYEV